MEEVFKKIFEGKSDEELSSFLVNLNKFWLNRKDHIKKYNRLRKLHSEVVDSMVDYIVSDKYSIADSFNSIVSYIKEEIPNVKFDLDSDNPDDCTIINELFMYRCHPKLTSVTEIYLKKNKFRNADKVKMLNSMNNSYVGLFKVIDVFFDDGYVIYEDVFTKKRFKVIDIAMSSTLKIDKKRMVYVYNRIITFDDISFGTGIHCMMTSDNKFLKDFIKKHDYRKISDFSRCILLYDLSKKEKDLTVCYNNKFGNRN